MSNFIGDQENIFKKIIKFVESNSRALTFKGLPGSGKTYLLEQCEKKVPYQCFFLKGDKNISSDYYPVNSLITKLFSSQSGEINKHQHEEMAKDILPEIGTIIPGFGAIIKKVAQMGVRAKENSQKLHNPIYNSDELDMLHKISSFIRTDNRIIFLCDNIQYWDEASKNLFYLLAKNGHTFFTDCHFIFSITIDEDGAPSTDFQKFSEISEGNTCSLSYIPFSEYTAVLKTLGLNVKLDESLLPALYSISNGNLETTKLIVALVNEGKETQQVLSRLHNEKDLTNLMFERLERRGDHGVQINNALRYASLFGVSFQYYELQRALEQEERNVREVISNARKYELVKEDCGGVEFSHEFIHGVYKEAVNEKPLDYYYKYAECIKVLYPNRYKDRAEAMELAQEVTESLVLKALSLVMRFRSKIDNSKQDLSEEFPVRYIQFLTKMQAAYQFFNKNKYAQCKNALEEIGLISDYRLQAEKAYLMSITLSKWLDAEYRNEAEVCLEPYLKKKDLSCETELWERILSAYLIALVHNNKIEQARKTNKILSDSIAERIDYDIDASIAFNVLGRKSASIETPEKAFALLKDSVNFFAPKNICDGVSVAPLQYYMSLTNLIASALKSGNYKDERENISELIRLPEIYNYLSFPRFSMPRNNIVVAAFLNGEISCEEALEALKDVLKEFNPEEAVSFVVSTNIAIFEAMLGNYANAKKMLSDILLGIDSSHTVEPYYKYLACVNYGAILVLENNVDRGRQLFHEILNDKRICANERHQYHIESLLDSLDDFTLANGAQWYMDSPHKPTSQKGRMYLYYGRKYLFGELEFWSES